MLLAGRVTCTGLLSWHRRWQYKLEQVRRPIYCRFRDKLNGFSASGERQ